jgi:hypothetical protein
VADFFIIRPAKKQLITPLSANHFMLLLVSRKTIQYDSAAFLFHIAIVYVTIKLTAKNNLFFTGFTHHNLRLWKSCGNQPPNPQADLSFKLFLMSMCLFANAERAEYSVENLLIDSASGGANIAELLHSRAYKHCRRLAVVFPKS